MKVYFIQKKIDCFYKLIAKIATISFDSKEKIGFILQVSLN